MGKARITHRISHVADNQLQETSELTLRGQEQTLGDQLCDGLQSIESCDAKSNALALPPPPSRLR
jgi:hypothetical protein